MRCFYLSSVCAQTRFDQLVARGEINGQFQNQKFHHLILEGLVATGEVELSVVSFYPVIRNKGNIHKYEEEIEDGVHYYYPKYTDKPILHHITKFYQTYRFLRKHQQPNSVIICNIMNFDECLAAILFRMLCNVSICAITADIPGITSGSGKALGAWWKRGMNRMVYPFYKRMSRCYDAYMFLSQAMNDVVNPKNKQYIVVEGLADLSMRDLVNTTAGKYTKTTLMYAGGIHGEYGIALLLEAFQKLEDQNVELHVFGKGNYEKELINATKRDCRIKYFGTKPNSEIVVAQLKAHLLINPRPTSAEFVKYSFPSKIMECMASGTPLLTTRIPSLPSEYYPYIYTIDDESVDGLYNTLYRILSLPRETLQNKGQSAKEFILKEKNYKVQAAKLLHLLKGLIN